jgi:hypothetical protein
MSRSRYQHTEVTAAVDAAEALAIAEMRAMGGLRSDSDVIRMGLWHFARHLGHPLKLDEFRLRGRPDPRTRSQHK